MPHIEGGSVMRDRWSSSGGALRLDPHTEEPGWPFSGSITADTIACVCWEGDPSRLRAEGKPMPSQPKAEVWRFKVTGLLIVTEGGGSIQRGWIGVFCGI